jgi:hypothetical protein
MSDAVCLSHLSQREVDCCQILQALNAGKGLEMLFTYFVRVGYFNALASAGYSYTVDTARRKLRTRPALLLSTSSFYWGSYFSNGLPLNETPGCRIPRRKAAVSPEKPVSACSLLERSKGEAKAARPPASVSNKNLPALPGCLQVQSLQGANELAESLFFVQHLQLRPMLEVISRLGFHVPRLCEECAGRSLCKRCGKRCLVCKAEKERKKADELRIRAEKDREREELKARKARMQK